MNMEWCSKTHTHTHLTCGTTWPVLYNNINLACFILQNTGDMWILKNLLNMTTCTW